MPETFNSLLVHYTHEPQGWLHLDINFTNEDIKLT